MTLNRRSALLSGSAFVVLMSDAHAADKSLATLFDRFAQEDLDLSPTNATSLGLDVGARARQRSLIDDTSLAGIAKSKALTASQLARLKTVDRAKLTGTDAVNYDVVAYGLKNQDDANRRFS